MTQYVILLVIAGIGYALVSYLWPSGRNKKDGKSPPPRRPHEVGGDAPWHEVLGVARDATPDQIKQAYRTLIAQYHPDRVAQMGPEIRAVAEEKSKQLNAAYEFGLASRRFGG